MAQSSVITVICTGNVCRSPMAERLLQHALKAESGSLSDITVQSAGVSAYNGDPASENAVKALSKVGLDLTDHRSRRLNEPILEESALTLVMTENHRALIEHFFPDNKTPVLLFRELKDGQGADIPDPFGGSLEQYIETRDSIAESIPAILEYLKTLSHE